jgi:hypothetical protein
MSVENNSQIETQGIVEPNGWVNSYGKRGQSGSMDGIESSFCWHGVVGWTVGHVIENKAVTVRGFCYGRWRGFVGVGTKEEAVSKSTNAAKMVDSG